MESLVAGILMLVIGAAVAGYGVRLFHLLLPVFGFLVGLVLGAQLVTAILGDAFLATVAGWGVGVVLGIVLAVVAGVWYWAAIVILAGGAGWMLGTGLVAALGITDGLLPLVAGAVLAAVVAIVTIAVDGPTLLVAVLTSLAGSAYAVAGVMLVLRQATLAELEHGAVQAIAGDTVALIAWLVVAVAALAFQLLDARGRAADLLAGIGRPTTS